MKTIIRLITFAALMVMPFVVSAQENVQDTVDREVVNPEWCRHLIGTTTLGDDASNIECDSIKWLYTDTFNGISPFRVYVVRRGNYIGRYVQYFKTPKDKTKVQDAVLVKVVYRNGLDFRAKQVLTGRIPNEDYYLKQAGVRKELSPSEKVWLKFWEVHLKNEAKKSE